MLEIADTKMKWWIQGTTSRFLTFWCESKDDSRWRRSRSSKTLKSSIDVIRTEHGLITNAKNVRAKELTLESTKRAETGGTDRDIRQVSAKELIAFAIGEAER